MKLLTLPLHNFMGIRDFTLDTRGGKNVSIYADNGGGKTTLFSAFNWLLFGKDSLNRSDFDIKTLDADNRPLPGLDHSVEAVLDLDGPKLTLKKIYKEVWTKKRGSATAEFTGHTVDYFVDGVPTPKKEYDKVIADIADEATFRLLTNPRYFNDHLHWQKRREILLTVCGDVTDADVIASSRDLSALPGILGDRPMDKHRDYIKAQLSAINKELQQIPVRIDEANRALPDLTGLSRTAFENELHVLATLKQGKEQERLRLESGGEVAEKRKRLAEVEGELLGAKNKLRADFDAEVSAARSELRSIEDSIDRLDAQFITPKSRAISGNAREIERLDGELKSLRANWQEVNDRVFDQDDKCPTCGQDVPPEQTEEARAAFNQRKSDRLESIDKSGRSMKAEIDRLRQHNEELRAEIEQAEAESRELVMKRDACQARVDDIQDQAQDIEQAPAYQDMLEGKQLLLDAIAALEQDSGPALEAALVELTELEEKMATARLQLQKFTDHARGQERIQELRGEQKSLAAEYEQLEKELNLCDEFTRAKVRLLDEKINSRFLQARFKMFEEQVNGGLAECCETLGGGVPWSSGLNNGAQIQIGLDIISTLSDHYGMRPCVWIDNSESVTSLPEMENQLIRLVVSEKDKKLRVEVEA
ncbi:MAG: AAA family ATPase [Thermodesulfobacteriota bacterium]|nr:AAA family ATPase [Thermodesulfobacteriota bacterium]